SKDQKQQRADLVTRLNDAAEAVRATLAAVNAEIAGKLNSAIENYNLVVSVVEAFRDEIVSEMEYYASDRSDRWQKSERGQRHEGLVTGMGRSGCNSARCNRQNRRARNGPCQRIRIHTVATGVIDNGPAPSCLVNCGRLGRGAQVLPTALAA